MAQFKVNEEVMARWPGSSLWFEAWVVDLNDIEYQVRFDDETKSEFILKYRDVKSRNEFLRRSGSKGRSQSRGRSRSRGRQAKGRSPGRKSPARNKSPSRKGLGRPSKKQIAEHRVEKLITTSTTTTEEVTMLKQGAETTEALVWGKNDSLVSSLRPRMARADLHTPRTSTPTRQSVHLTAITDKVNDVEVNNVKSWKVTTEDAVKPQSPGSRLCGVACRAGGMVKGVLRALVPSLATITTLPAVVIMFAMPIVLNEMCTKKKCTVMEFPSIPRSLQYYYDPLAVAAVLGFVVVQMLLCFVPLGRKVLPRSGVSVRCNGFVAILLTLSVVPLCLYLDYNILVIYSKYRQLMATSLLLGLVLAFIAYIHGHYILNDAKNPAGNSGCFLPDLFVGREVAPAVLSLDLKFVLLRVTCLAQILINTLIAVKDLQAHPGQYSPTLLLAATVQIFYAANWIWFEDAFFTTYEYQRQGFGLLLILEELTLPFLLPIFTRFVFNHRTELEWYCLMGIILLNLIGYTICRGANNQKHAFRTNPSDPALARLESLPTSAGSRLLVSGWWGLVRHPNYLGDILIFISWALICGFSHALPWLLVGLDVLFLVARTYEVEECCGKKYGTAWDGYTKRVKCRLIPKVF